VAQRRTTEPDDLPSFICAPDPDLSRSDSAFGAGWRCAK
jgi:hypothetical protein